MRRLVVAVLACVAVTPGCSVPALSYLCDADGDCPVDQACVDGICGFLADAGPDGGSDDDDGGRGPDDGGLSSDDGGPFPEDAGTGAADGGPADSDAGTAGDDAGEPPPDAGPSAVCGNGALEAGEACDDANLLERDGCSSACRRWWDEAFPVRLRLTLRSPAVTTVEVPVGVALPAASFPPGAPRDQVCMVAADHRSVLPVEIERAATATEDALVWARLTLPVGDTDVFGYFGSDAACLGGQAQVWADYAGVFHFQGRADSVAAVPFVNAGSGPTGTIDGRRGAALTVSSAGWPQVTPPGALWITGSVTLEVWGRLSAFGGATSWENTLFQAAGDGASQAYFLNIENSGRLRVYWESSLVDELSTAAITLTVDQWHHYVMVRDNAAGTVRFYVDGAQLGSAVTFSGPPTDTPGGSSFIYFGGNFTSVARRFSGTLDEARIAPAALSADVIAVSHAATAGTLVVATTLEQ